MSAIGYDPDAPAVRKAARAAPGSITEADREVQPPGAVLIDERHGNALVRNDDGRWITVDVWSSDRFTAGWAAARKVRSADLAQKGISAVAGVLFGLFLLLIRGEPPMVPTILLGIAGFVAAVLTVLAIVRNIRLMKLAQGASEWAFRRVAEVRDPSSLDAGPWRSRMFSLPPLDTSGFSAPPAPTIASHDSRQPAFERLAGIALVLNVFFAPAAVVVGIVALARTQRNGTRGRGVAIGAIAYGAAASMLAVSIGVITLIGLWLATASDAPPVTASHPRPAATSLREEPEDVIQASAAPVAPAVPVDATGEAATLAAQRQDVRALVQALDMAYPLTGSYPPTGQVDDSTVPLHPGNHVVNFTSNGQDYSFKVTSDNSSTDLLFKSAVGGMIYEVPEA